MRGNTVRSRRFVAKSVALLCVGSLIAVGCGDDGGNSGGAAGTTGGSNTTGVATTTTAAPVKGGILNISTYSSAPGLDPAKSANSGTAGGMEIMALYDTLIAYDTVTLKYAGRTAQSLESNADFTTWTLKLKPGITFGDGTAYNADAVKFSIEREMKDGNSAPKGQLTQFIKTITIVDQSTLTFDLKLGWAGFPYLLSGVGGMIYSPTQFAKVGDAAKFNVEPGLAGAGPFRVKSYKPGESLELERNPSYWGGDVALDGLKFTQVAGSTLSYEALKANTVQAGFFLDQATIAKAKSEKFDSNLALSMAGNLIMMNSGVEVTCTGGQPAASCAGKADGTKVTPKTATSDLKVRKAVAASVDPKVVNERAYSGAAKPNSAPFAGSPWDPKVDGPKYDLVAAKQLVTDAKAAGWDGKIRLLAPNTPDGQTWSEAVRSQLAAAGMDATADTSKDTPGIVQAVLVNRDFDLTTWGIALIADADAAYLSLIGSFGSAAKRYGYSSPDMDAAIEMLRTADTDAKRTAGFKQVAEIWNRDVPAQVITSLQQGLVWTPKLHGVTRTAYQNYFFDKAWLAK
jgi:peptide/nickel transport system substrate-binding protein